MTNQTTKEKPETITAGGILLFFILSGFFWFYLFAQFFIPDVHDLHYVCGNVEINLKVVSKDMSLNCSERV